MRETPILRPPRESMLETSGRAAPVDTAQPVGGGCVSQVVFTCAFCPLVTGGCRLDNKHTQRRLDVGAHQPVAAIAFDVLLAQAGDPPLGQADADIDLVGTEGRDHVASAGGEGDQLGIQAEVLAGEVDRGGKMLRHVADAERGRGHGGCGCWRVRMRMRMSWCSDECLGVYLDQYAVLAEESVKMSSRETDVPGPVWASGR